MMPTSAIGREGPPTEHCARYGGELDEGFEWVVDADLADFFDSMPHDLVERAVAHHTDLAWVRLYVGAVAARRRCETGWHQGGADQGYPARVAP